MDERAFSQLLSNGSESFQARNHRFVHPRGGAHNREKERENDCDSKERSKAIVDNSSRGTGTVSQDYGEYSFSITVLYSNFLRRDVISAAETILDIIVTCGRLLDADFAADDAWDESRERSRRRNHTNHTKKESAPEGIDLRQ